MHSKKAIIALLKNNPNKKIHFKHVDMNGEKVFFDIYLELIPADEKPFYVEINVPSKESKGYQKILNDSFKNIFFIFNKHCIADGSNVDIDYAKYVFDEEIFKNFLSWLIFKNFERI